MHSSRAAFARASSRRRQPRRLCRRALLPLFPLLAIGALFAPRLSPRGGPPGEGDAAGPIRTGGGTRRVPLVGGGGGGSARTATCRRGSAA